MSKLFGSHGLIFKHIPKREIYIAPEFSKQILTPTLSEGTSTSTSGIQLQFLVSRLIRNMSPLGRLHYRKKGLKNYRKFISQEHHIRILT